MTPFTLSIASTCLLAASAVVFTLAAFRGRDVPTGAFFGENPYAIKAGMYSRAETIAGLVLVLIGAILGLMAAGHPETKLEFWEAPERMWEPNLLLALLVAVMASFLAERAAHGIQKPRVRRMMIDSQREVWEQAHFVLTHGGRYPREEPITDLSEDVRRQRLEGAQRNIAQIEALLDLVPLKDDTLEARLARIESLFSR